MNTRPVDGRTPTWRSRLLRARGLSEPWRSLSACMRWPESFFAITAASAVAKAHRSLRWITEGIQGETAVTELLQGLPDDYFLLNDVVLPGHPGNIDHVVVGLCGIVVIETKNFSGSVESHGNGRFVNGRRSRSIRTVQRQGRSARTLRFDMMCFPMKGI